MINEYYVRCLNCGHAFYTFKKYCKCINCKVPLIVGLETIEVGNRG